MIAAVKSDELLVRIQEIPVDGTIPLDSLPSDRYRFDRETHTLEGFRGGNRFRLGDSLQVRIERVDLTRRKLYLTCDARNSLTPSQGSTPRPPNDRPARGGRPVPRPSRKRSSANSAAG
ncbi:MAG: S1 RNA-binding domain-containing protein, partial [bacterium]